MFINFGETPNSPSLSRESRVFPKLTNLITTIKHVEIKEHDDDLK
jgi:hypothetical protein